MVQRKAALLLAQNTYDDHNVASLPDLKERVGELANALADPEIGEYRVVATSDSTAAQMRSSLTSFTTTDGEATLDVALVYFGGHCFAADGQLYLVAKDTVVRNAASAIGVDEIIAGLATIRARFCILILDCHTSGVAPRLESSSWGQGGVAVILAGWDEPAASARLVSAPLAEALTRGLTSGEADRNGDGKVDLEELFAFLQAEETGFLLGGPNAVPTMSTMGNVPLGSVIVARSPVSTTAVAIQSQLRLSSPLVLGAHAGAVTCGVWVTAGGQTRLVTGGEDGRLIVWDERGPVPELARTGSAPVRWCVRHPTQPIVVAGLADNTVISLALDTIGHAAAAPVPVALTPTTQPLQWGAVDHDGALILGSHDGAVLRYSAGGSPATLFSQSVQLRWGTATPSGSEAALAFGGMDGTFITAPGGAVNPLRASRDDGSPVPSNWGAWTRINGASCLAVGGRDGYVYFYGTDGLPIPQLSHKAARLSAGDDQLFWGRWAHLGANTVVFGAAGDYVTIIDIDDAAAPGGGVTVLGAVTDLRWVEPTVIGGRAVIATGQRDGTVRLWRLIRERAVPRRPSYRSDDLGLDTLDRSVDAMALADLVTSRSAKPPLAMGLFGEWGEGKSHFLDLLHTEVRNRSADENTLSYRNIRQIQFNAWHYAETDLWASLVSEVFTQLARDDADVALVQRQQSRLVAELVAERRIPERLAALRARREQLRRTLAETANAPREIGVSERSEIASAVRDLDPEFADEVHRSVSTAAAWSSLRRLQLNRLLQALWPISLPVVAVLTLIVVLAYRIVPVVYAHAALVATTIAAVALATRFARQFIGRVRAVANALRRAIATMDKQLQTSISVVDAEITQLEQQWQQLTAAGQLAALVTDRVADGRYRRSLGLMTQIREDFARMSRLLVQDSAEEPAGNQDWAGDTLPKIDRIVLYIDDLDRCPPKRVVEMLEAIHLLLAVPLFVVVVAVDPRWLLQAIAANYRDVFAPEVSGPDDRPGWSSSPSHYLEKIFQVVYSLPEMTEAGYQSMLTDLLGARVDDSAAVNAPMPHADFVVETGSGQLLIDVKAGQLINASVDTEPRLPVPPVVDRVDPLALDAHELQLLALVGPPIITTPRAAKRLANSYGLLCAIDRLSAQPSSGAQRLPAVVLLAAQVGSPVSGAWLIAQLDRAAAKPIGTWEGFLEAISRPVSAMSPEGGAAGRDRDGAQLIAALRRVTDAARDQQLPLPDLLTDWLRWAPLTARLSFPVAKVPGP